MSLMSTAFGLASPAGAGARLSTLIFHRVKPELDPLFPEEMHAGRFDEMCSWLARDFNVLPLAEAVRALAQGRLPARACCITFDDGYADNLHIAAPILHKHGLSATVFVATGFLDGGRMWNDTVIEVLRRAPGGRVDGRELGLKLYELESALSRRRAALDVIDTIKYLPVAERVSKAEALACLCGIAPPTDLMLSSDELRRLRGQGIAIGGHTVSHPILARLDPAAAREEISAGREQLQMLLGERIGLFAYPNGRPGRDYLPEHAEMVRELGFDAAVSTRWGASHAGTDRFQLPRFTPWDTTRTRFGLRMLRNLF
ncbi:MAG: polysaccharide deacetylase family protein [Paucibacter sp.]|nr:polysaccharide deacetylase family protein [Roseateles sp.]